MPYYVALDIGCIECGEISAVLGLFTNLENAEVVAEDHRIRHNANWHGQHSFEVHEVGAIDIEQRVDYGDKKLV